MRVKVQERAVSEYVWVNKLKRDSLWVGGPKRSITELTRRICLFTR